MGRVEVVGLAMESTGVYVAQCFEGGTTFGLFEELAHFATRVVTVVEICHVWNPSTSWSSLVARTLAVYYSKTIARIRQWQRNGAS
jgi:hypothetical protein